MIGVDSNLLLRLFVDDDPGQHRRAVAFFAARSAEEPVYVNVLVLAELVWLLSRRFSYPSARVLDLIVAMLTNAGFVLEHAELVSSAVEESRAHHAGFADSLIQLLNLAAGCSATMTFDRRASDRLPGMNLLK